MKVDPDWNDTTSIKNLVRRKQRRAEICFNIQFIKYGGARCVCDEDGPEALTVGSFFGVTMLSPKRRKEEGDV